MKQIKICPDCGTEYFAHVQRCADCGAALLLPEENTRLQEERKQCSKEMLKDPVVVREGELAWIDELRQVLIASSVPSSIQADTCNKGCCGNTCRLLVSSKDAEKATGLIEEHYMNVHPEIRTSREMMDEGKCPACGSAVGSDTVQCPECGLTLLIIE